MLATGVYQSIAAGAESHSSQRLSLSYLLSRLRAGDVANAIQLKTFGEGDALVLLDGEYSTTLYCYEGHLMELYADATLMLEPDAGTPIAPAKSLSIRYDGDLLSLTVSDPAGENSTATYLVKSANTWEGSS